MLLVTRSGTPTAGRMLDLYRSGLNRMRRHLHRDMHAIFNDEVECPTRRNDAFCKLLDDASEYAGIPSQQAASLRMQVVRTEASRHPLVNYADRWCENQEDKAKHQVAAELGEEWSNIEHRLFGDLPEARRLENFNDLVSPDVLLVRYNVAQTQFVANANFRRRRTNFC